jgi:hypothetical protein
MYGIHTFFALVAKEMDMGIHQCNGENNKSVLSKELFTHFGKYISASRQMLRMMWFINYLILMFEEIGNNRTCKISDCSSKAYEEALAPNHTFLVKTAARAAMMATPNRKNILHMVVEADKTDDFAYETITQIVTAMKPVRDGLWKHYREKGIDKLP